MWELMCEMGFGGAAETTMRSIASSPSSDFAFFGGDMDAARAHFAGGYLCELAASPKAPPPPPPPPCVPASPEVAANTLTTLKEGTDRTGTATKSILPWQL